MKNKMTTSELKKYVMLEATRLYEKQMLKELDDDYDFRRDAEPKRKRSENPYGDESDLDFNEELSIVLSNVFSPVVKKFLLNKRAEHPDLDWGDFEDEDNVSSIFEDSHNRKLLNITDKEVIDIAGDIRDEIYRKRFDKMFDNPMGQLDDLSDSLGLKKESKMTISELKKYVISEAARLYKIEVLKEEKSKIDKELNMLNEDYLPDVPSPEKFEKMLNSYKEFEEITDDVVAIEKYIELCHWKIEESLMYDDEDGSFVWQSRIKAAMNKLKELLSENDPKFQEIAANHKKRMKQIFSH